MIKQYHNDMSVCSGFNSAVAVWFNAVTMAVFEAQRESARDKAARILKACTAAVAGRARPDPVRPAPQHRWWA